jgi:hypothetical protein
MLGMRHHDDAMSGCIYHCRLAGCEIEGARWVGLTGGGLRAWLRGVAFAAAAAVSAGGCSLVPDMSEFRLPNRNTFLPTSTAAYVGPVSRTGPVGPADFVDGQGYCSGGGNPTETTAGQGRSVGLEMTECEVVRSLGPPQSTQIGDQGNGVRSAVLTYHSGDRPGVYRFSGGRLKAIEQGDEPLPAAKPPAKKPKNA